MSINSNKSNEIADKYLNLLKENRESNEPRAIKAQTLTSICNQFFMEIKNKEY